MNRNLIIVHTPFHAMIALEFSKQYKIYADLYVIYDQEKYLINIRDICINSNLTLIGHTKIIYGPSASFLNRALELLSLFFKIKVFVKNNMVMTFQPCSFYIKYLFKLLYVKKVVVAEEGLANITYKSLYKSCTDELLFGKREAEIISIFNKNLLECPFPVLELSLGHLSKLCLKKNIINKTIIIGGPYVYDELVSKKDYYGYLNNIYIKYGKCDYYPHRREDVFELKRNVKHIIVQNNEPIELSMVNSVELPARIISGYSYAIFTLGKILPSKVELNISKMMLDDSDLQLKIISHIKKNKTYKRINLI